MIARPLAQLRSRLYASARYIERHGEPGTPSALTEHECLCLPTSRTWTLSDGSRTIEVAVGGRFRLNSVGMIRQLATLDLGIAFISEELVADELANGQGATL